MKKILIVDIETTGLSLTDKIVEIGIVDLDLDNGMINILFNERIKESGLTKQMFENSYINKISSLSTKHVMSARSLEDWKPEIQKIINSYPLGITAYNNSFDFRFLESRGIKLPIKLACPMRLAKNLCRVRDKRGSIKYPTVTEAYKILLKDNSYVEDHRGASDAIDEALIIHYLYKKGIFKLSDRKYG